MDNPYSSQFYSDIDDGSLRSANIIAELVWTLVRPTSVVDIGCGVGNLLSVLQTRFGVDDLLGVDGDYVDRSMLKIPVDKFMAHDLNRPLPLDRTFDLATSLEVAEHVEPENAEQFVKILCSLSRVVAFSAAIPSQGGSHHVNEQWPEYWASFFGAQGYLTLDPFRSLLWSNPAVEWWYAQNLLLFAHETVVKGSAELVELWRETDPARLSIVHPRCWLRMVSIANQSGQ